MEKINPFDVVKQQVDRCAEILDLSPDVTAMLKTPMRELHITASADGRWLYQDIPSV